MNVRSEAELDLAGLVHDLNNVLETIAEAAELLSEQGAPAELAAAITRSVERGRRLVGSIEDGTRGTDLDTVVDRAAGFLQDLSAHLKRSVITVTRRFEPGIRLRGQEREWERVFMNLFLNAAQAMPRGGNIDVAAEVRNGAVRIEVSDNGPGIPAGIVERIFEPNFSTRDSHSGLGLHIVDSIVRRHGGIVRAGNRQEPSGAHFVIELAGPGAEA